jgi:hypothetical protein
MDILKEINGTRFHIGFYFYLIYFDFDPAVDLIATFSLNVDSKSVLISEDNIVIVTNYI